MILTAIGGFSRGGGYLQDFGEFSKLKELNGSGRQKMVGIRD